MLSGVGKENDDIIDLLAMSHTLTVRSSEHVTIFPRTPPQPTITSVTGSAEIVQTERGEDEEQRRRKKIKIKRKKKNSRERTLCKEWTAGEGGRLLK